MNGPIILKSKLTFPRLGKDIMDRELSRQLRDRMDGYPVCVVVASAGFGKTTLLAQALQDRPDRLSWFTPGPEDDSAYVFIAYMAVALDKLSPGLAAWYFEHIDGSKFSWQRAFESLMSGLERMEGSAGYLVIDDWQLIRNDPEIVGFMDRFLSCKPEGLRLILASREQVMLPYVDRLRAEGRLLELKGKDLAFSRDELNAFIQFLAPGKELDNKADKIFAYTEGWPIAIKMVINARSTQPMVPHSTFGSLFDYLSSSILQQMDEQTRRFLIHSAIPDFFGHQLCQDVLGVTPGYVDDIVRQGIFVNEVNTDVYRYHPLFRDFLLRQAIKNPTEYKAVHQSLAEFYIKRLEYEKALGSLIAAEDWPRSGEVLCQLARELVYHGRSQVFLDAFGKLPREQQSHPMLMLALGDEARYKGKHVKALDWYKQAEEAYRQQSQFSGVSLALRAMGEVYLETMEPRAGDLLFQAYRLLGKDKEGEKAQLLDLMAENMVNQGRPKQAEHYRKMALRRKLQKNDVHNLNARMLLRTGRLQEAIQVLERISKQGEEQTKIHSAFREAPMLLSTCYSFVGNAPLALSKAREAIHVGEQAGLMGVRGLGYIRLGHAWLIKERTQLEEAQTAYLAAAELLRDGDVIRVHSELCMGRCLLYALGGKWPEARKVGLEGLDIASTSKDEWFAALLSHVLGMSATICGQLEEAETYLLSAQQRFAACADSFGRCVGLWWLSYLAYIRKDSPLFIKQYLRFTELLEVDQYQFLLDSKTLFGDLLGGQAALLQQAFMDQASLKSAPALVKELQPDRSRHLMIYSLGSFSLVRDGLEVPLTAWRRKNSLRLFTLFLVKRRSLLSKEDILTYLWPDADQDFAERNLKSALYNLNKVLEPERRAWGSSHFIQRSGSTYFFNLAADYWFDAEEFSVNTENAKKIWRSDPKRAEQLIQSAFLLYKGDFFAGVNMDDWCLEEREQLILSLIQCAEIMADIHSARGEHELALQMADLILDKDKYWEKAYQIKISSYIKLNNPVMASRTFKLCQQRFQEDMGVSPSQETIRAYQAL